MPLMSVKLKNRILAVDPTMEVHLQNIRINGDPRGCSGFVRNPANGRIAYLSTESSCYGPLSQRMLYRTAKHLKDYTGGSNHWSTETNLVGDVLYLLK